MRSSQLVYLIFACLAIQVSALTTNEENALRDFITAFPGLQYVPSRWNVNDIKSACGNRTWTGLECSAKDGNVVSITLNLYQLGVNPQGYLPVSISNFTSLRQFTLFAKLSYTIPATLGALSNLEYLSLSGSSLQGPIPITLGNLLSLSYLDLSSNQLTGALPDSFAQLQQLKHLALAGNPIDVKSSIIEKLSNLRHLDLSYTKSLDSIPCILPNPPVLEFMLLEASALNGVHIPDCLSQMTSLKQLFISGSMGGAGGGGLVGTIPRSLGKLVNLERIAFGSNKLNGTIPDSLGALSKLQYLSLAVNPGIVGTLPASFQGLKSLMMLHLEHTGITGSLENLLGAWRNLESLLCSNMKLSGALPDVFGNLKSLKNILLNNNQLTGPIPPSIGQLPSIEMIDLSSNNLTGPIPASIQNLNTLQGISLRYNAVSGCFNEPANLKGCNLAGTAGACTCKSRACASYACNFCDVTDNMCPAKQFVL